LLTAPWRERPLARKLLAESVGLDACGGLEAARKLLRYRSSSESLAELLNLLERDHDSGPPLRYGGRSLTRSARSTRS